MEKHTTTFTLFSLLCSSSYPADIMERLQGESQIPTHQTCRSELPIVDSLAAIIQYCIQCSYFPNCQSPHVTHFNCRSCIFECPCFCTLFVFPDKFGCGKLCYTNLGMLSLDEYVCVVIVIQSGWRGMKARRRAKRRRQAADLIRRCLTDTLLLYACL